ncbi:MAG: hypothetical protein JW773_08095 [Desulfuromonadales bacterium]|nr:hypothetical protein [Desulfuromonadales bacterium]
MEVAVVGLGTIGIKLIEYLAEKNINIVAYNHRNIDAKKSAFTSNVEKKVKYGKLSYINFEQLINRVRFTSEIKDVSSCPLILESAKETYDIKKNIYEQLKKISGKDSLLATTTSSLSLDKLSKLFHPDKFIGIHFFNPPTKMKLIELSFMPQNSEAVKNTVYRFLSKLDDKKVIEIPPVQGYIVNNILFNYINYAILYSSEYEVGFQNIDESMKLGTNVPMGPLELSDYIGNDVTLQILTELYSATNDTRFKPHEKLVSMVEEGLLGRKTKEGFYKY